MLGSFTNEAVQGIIYQMLVLAVSVFCLTSLDTATRLARYMFQEFWLNEGETPKDATGVRGVLANPYVSTAITVVLGVALGLTGYSKIWPLFGAANQLLAALGLMAVCAWLGHVQKNNKMFFFPMIFMLCVNATAEGITAYTNEDIQAMFTAAHYDASQITAEEDGSFTVDISAQGLEAYANYYASASSGYLWIDIHFGELDYERPLNLLGYVYDELAVR